MTKTYHNKDHMLNITCADSKWGLMHGAFWIFFVLNANLAAVLVLFEIFSKEKKGCVITFLNFRGGVLCFGFIVSRSGKNILQISMFHQSTTFLMNSILLL